MREKHCPGCMRMKTQPVCEHCGWDESVQNALHQLPVGTVLKEQYLVGRVLGQGGFGITYIGWDLYLDVPVAIKEYYPSGIVMRESTTSLEVNSFSGEMGDQFRNNRERFLREAKVLARLSQIPEIVHVHNYFLANNTAYIVMEYIQGMTLITYTKKRGGRLSIQETFELLRPVMEAMANVHKAGLIHRDISPDNIMLLPNGRIKLIDFGAVREVSSGDGETTVQKSTDVILKHGYAPMEQYLRQGNIGPWTDVYALCATVYRCLSGDVPQDAPERIMNGETVRFTGISGLTAHQAQVLEQGMALRAEDRIQDMDQLCQELFAPEPAPEEKAKTGKKQKKTGEKKPPKQKKEARKPQSRKKGRILAAVTAVLAAVVILAGAAYLYAVPVGAGEKHRALPQSSTLLQLPEAHLVSQRWRNNVLAADPVTNPDNPGKSAVYGASCRRDQVVEVSFWDHLEDMPSSAWDVSADGSGRVMAWLESQGHQQYHLNIGAKDGINGKDACEDLFYGYTNLVAVNFHDCFHTDQATSMKRMFYGCTKLKELDVSSFRTDKVTSMQNMFNNCASLTALDLGNFRTENVINMRCMFQDCVSLESLNISSFDTGRVEDMAGMFEDCSKVTELNVSGFRTENVTGMEGMFRRCSSVKELDVSGFRTPKLKSMYSMFEDCASVEVLDLSGFDTAGVEDMNSLFYGCAKLTDLKLGGLDTSAAKNLSYMFYGCSRIKELDVSGFQTRKAEDMSYMFCGCSRLQKLDVTGFVTSNVRNMAYMFSDTDALTRLNLNQFDFSAVTEYTNFMDEGVTMGGKPWEILFDSSANSPTEG